MAYCQSMSEKDIKKLLFKSRKFRQEDQALIDGNRVYRISCSDETPEKSL